ncbi:hypothetical protein [Streptomyces sp. Ag109_G2-15]|nr:hypothetical protein [Streptomyces sp. Ag109_G2-15]
MTRTGAVFTTPWPLRINPHLDQARENAPVWTVDRTVQQSAGS